MREFFETLYDDLMHETWAEDGPSTWFLIDTIMASIGNVVFIVLAIIGLAGDLRGADTLNDNPWVYQYTLYYMGFLIIIVICALKCTCSHPYGWGCHGDFDEQRKFYPFYMMGYVFLSPVGLVVTSLTLVVLFFTSIQDIIERAILNISNFKEWLAERKEKRKQSRETNMLNKYNQFLTPHREEDKEW